MKVFIIGGDIENDKFLKLTEELHINNYTFVSNPKLADWIIVWPTKNQKVKLIDCYNFETYSSGDNFIYRNFFK